MFSSPHHLLPFIRLCSHFAKCVRRLCVRMSTKTLFGYSYVNRVSQQEKSKCVTMRYYAHKIRVYGSKMFYRSLFLSSYMCVYMYSCRNYLISVSLCICMMALFENMHVLTRITYMSMKNMKSPSAIAAAAAAMALENTNETWATKVYKILLYEKI